MLFFGEKAASHSIRQWHRNDLVYIRAAGAKKDDEKKNPFSIKV